MVFVLALVGCSDIPQLGRVIFVAETDTSFAVSCSQHNCHERAMEICRTQGFRGYEVLEETKGDELGEGRGVVIQCKKG